MYLTQLIEGRNLQVLQKGTSAAKTSTIAYWIKSNKTGNYVVELWDRTNDRHVGKVVTISSANTWEKHVCNFPADTSGALANTNARSIMISWAFDSGSNFTSGTLPTSWASRVDANRFVGTNLGLGDNTANEVLITGVQWEVGTFDANSIPPFQFEDGGASLARCQRYFQKSFPQGTTPQNYSSYVAGQSDNSIGAVMASTEFKTVITLKCEMRSAPTITFFKAQNTPDDGEWTYWDGGDNLNPSSIGANSQTHRFTVVMGFSGGGKNTGRAGLVQGNYTADAEL
jgi:hypothetical protein